MGRSDLVPGARFPDLVLPDHVGNERRLSDLAGGNPLLLHFYRGWWCPKEQAYFRRLLMLQHEAEVAYTMFVSVSVDPPGQASAFRAGLGARWTFLSDDERAWIGRLDLMESTDSAHAPYLPTVFTLFPDLTIHADYDGSWYWSRPTNEELRRDLRKISRAARSDQDIS